MCGYNGYANRETWAADLWLSNDGGAYGAAQELIDKARADDSGRPTVAVLADALQEMWEAATDPDNYEAESYVRDVLPMVRDVGYAPAINWREIAEAALAD